MKQKIKTIALLLCCKIAYSQPQPLVKYSFENTLSPTIGTDVLTPVGNLYNYTTGQIGNALNITATGNNLQYFNMAQLYDFPQKTICFWFKPGTNASALTPFIYESDGPTVQNGETRFSINTPGSLTFDVGTNNFSAAYIPNQWNFAAIVRNASNTLYYLNCQLVATVGLSNATATSTTEQYPLFSRIGNTDENSGTWSPAPRFQYTGGLDEFAVYNTALSQSDLQSVMGNAGTPEQLVAVINGPSIFCFGSPITLDGSASYGTPFNWVNTTWWNIQPCNSSGVVLTGSTNWSSPGINGAPSNNYTFPTVANGGPTITCGQYYLVTMGILNSCAYGQTTKIIYVDCLPNFSAGPDKNLCPGTPIQIGNPYSDVTYINTPFGTISHVNPPETFYTFQWSPSTWLSNPISSNPTVAIPSGYSTPCPSSTQYQVTTTNGNGCKSTSNVTVNYATQATVPTITPSGPGISAACVNGFQSCSNMVTLTASSNCSSGISYQWWSGTPYTTSNSNSFIVFPTQFTYYGLHTSNICFTSTSWPSVMPCYRPTGAFPLYNIDNSVIVDWSGNNPQYGFHVRDNTIPDGSTPAYNADKIEVIVADQWGTIVYDHVYCATSCWGFWNGEVYWNPIYNGQPLPSPYTYAFKIIRTNCTQTETLSGSFDCTGTARIKNADGIEELQAIIGNVKSDQPEMLAIKNSTKDNSIFIYPNPSRGNFTIETEATTPQTVEMLDVTGRVVLTQTIMGNTSINAGSLSDGVYNVKISGNNTQVNKKVIISK